MCHGIPFAAAPNRPHVPLPIARYDHPEECAVSPGNASETKPPFDHVTVSVDGATGPSSLSLPVERGTLGNPCIDIAKLPKETGCFTYDPGFTATAA